MTERYVDFDLHAEETMIGGDLVWEEWVNTLSYNPRCVASANSIVI